MARKKYSATTAKNKNPALPLLYQTKERYLDKKRLEIKIIIKMTPLPKKTVWAVVKKRLKLTSRDITETGKTNFSRKYQTDRRKPR